MKRTSAGLNLPSLGGGPVCSARIAYSSICVTNLTDYLIGKRALWLYRQEAIQRQATNNPFRCSECGQEGAREWVYVVPGKAQRTVGRCYACLYSGFRNTALMSAAQITDRASRLQAMVAAMETAKLQALAYASILIPGATDISTSKPIVHSGSDVRNSTSNPSKSSELEHVVEPAPIRDAKVESNEKPVKAQRKES